MIDQKKYKQIKAYYDKFIKAYYKNLKDQIQDFRFYPNGGYANFYRGNEIVNILNNIEGNIEEKFGSMKIPENFVSLKSLEKNIYSFYEYLKSTETLFEDIFSKLNIKKGYSLPSILTGTYETTHNFLELFEHFIDILKDRENTKIDEEGIFNLKSVEKEIYEIIIITAIYEEYIEVKNILIDGNDKSINDGSRTIYYEASVGITANYKAKTLLVCANQMGLTSAANLATKLIYRYSPKLISMTGIAAGISGKIGDIMIPDILWDYGSGKNELQEIEESLKEKFSQYRFPVKSNQHMIGELIRIVNESDINNKIYNLGNEILFKGKSEILSTHIGPFVSGSAVIANDDILKSIKEQDGKLIGFDMEAFAIAYSAHFADISPKPIFLIIKSISDFGNNKKGHKDKKIHQKYAAFTSANCLIEIIKTHPSLVNLA
jgi:nucleoside phosphorylase